MRDVELDDCPDDGHQARGYRRIELITRDTRQRLDGAGEGGDLG